MHQVCFETVNIAIFTFFIFSYWAEKSCTRQQWPAVQRTPSRRSRRGHNSQICQTHQRIGTMAVMVFCLNWDDSTAGFLRWKSPFIILFCVLTFWRATPYGLCQRIYMRKLPTFFKEAIFNIIRIVLCKSLLGEQYKCRMFNNSDFTVYKFGSEYKLTILFLTNVLRSAIHW